MKDHNPKQMCRKADEEIILWNNNLVPAHPRQTTLPVLSPKATRPHGLNSVALPKPSQKPTHPKAGVTPSSLYKCVTECAVVLWPSQLPSSHWVSVLLPLTCSHNSLPGILAFATGLQWVAPPTVHSLPPALCSGLYSCQGNPARLPYCSTIACFQEPKGRNWFLLFLLLLPFYPGVSQTVKNSRNSWLRLSLSSHIYSAFLP